MAFSPKIQRKVPAPRIGCAVPFFETLMDVIAPHHVPLLCPHKIQLFPQAIDQSAHGVIQERGQIAARFAGVVELPVILSPGKIVVVAEKMGGR